MFTVPVPQQQAYYQMLSALLLRLATRQMHELALQLYAVLTSQWTELHHQQTSATLHRLASSA